MGSFDVNCGLTGRGIGCGDRMVAILLAKCEYTHNRPLKPTDHWGPMSLVFRGEYDDYGRILPDASMNGGIEDTLLRAILAPGDNTTPLQDVLYPDGCSDGIERRDPTTAYLEEPKRDCIVWHAHEEAYDWMLNRGLERILGYRGEEKFKNIPEILARALVKWDENIEGNRKLVESLKASGDPKAGWYLRDTWDELRSLMLYDREWDHLRCIAQNHGSGLAHDEFLRLIVFMIHRYHTKGEHEKVMSLAHGITNVITVSSVMWGMRKMYHAVGSVGPQYASESFRDIMAFNKMVVALDEKEYQERVKEGFEDEDEEYDLEQD